MHANVEVRHVLGPIVATADNTPAAIDLQGYNQAEIVLGIGVGGITFDSTNKIEFKVTHSDDDVTYSDVVTADMRGVTVTGSGIIKALTAAHASAAKYRFGYEGKKRYLKILHDFSGTHGAGTPVDIMVILGRPSVAPVANQA